MAVVVCGICGGSGAGKTTLTRRLAQELGLRYASVLAFDAYYRDLSHLPLPQRRARNFDHPDALDVGLFVDHLDALRRGRDVQTPVYDFSTHTFSGRFQKVASAPVLLVEGILLLAFAEIAQRLDYSVFLDVSHELRLRRRIMRDTAERGRHPDSVRRQFAETVTPMHDVYVQPYRYRADLIVRDPQPDRLSADLLAFLARQPGAPAAVPSLNGSHRPG